MYRNSTVGSLPLGLSRRLLAQCCSLFACALVFCGLVLFSGLTLEAQDTAGGGLQGTITDPNGAGVPKAEVTATNTDTGVQTSKLTSSTGTYQISPLQPGPYNVEVVAKGFKRFLQENVTIDANTLQGLNLKLVVGGEDTTVTVTDAPPFINTTESTLGGTIENELYSQLPLSMNGGPRDPTAFQYLMPGVQENPANDNGTGANNGNSGIYGGTGQTNLNENYIEGVPVSNINQQGSSNPVSNAVSVDAVDQFSVQTSTASTSFGGAGSTNYTIKAGGNQFHGSVVDFIRNTDFDTWGYFAKVPASSGFAEKPGEHQNQYDISLGGPIFKDKLFFFGDYAGFHYTKISNTPQYITIPTVAERTGNFTDVLGTAVGYITDPTLGSYGSRPAFQGVLNGVPTFNVIPSAEISSISNYLQQALPAPTNLSTFNNYLASLPQANSDYSVDARLDYTLNSRNKFSLVGVGGNVGYGGEPFYSTQTQLPNPYSAGQYTNQKTASGIFSYVYIVSQTLINTLKYGYSRNWGEGFSLTQGTKYNSAAAGITNLPPGNAANSMPAITFSQSNGPTPPTGEPNSNNPAWNSTASTGPVGTNYLRLQDALQWIKGRHNITFGIQVSWAETNGATFGGYSNTLEPHLQRQQHSVLRAKLNHHAGDLPQQPGRRRIRQLPGRRCLWLHRQDAVHPGRRSPLPPDRALRPGQLAGKPQADLEPRSPLQLPPALPRGQGPSRLPERPCHQSHRRHSRSAGICRASQSRQLPRSAHPAGLHSLPNTHLTSATAPLRSSLITRTSSRAWASTTPIPRPPCSPEDSPSTSPTPAA